MENYTAGQSKDENSRKQDFYRKYSAKVYELAQAQAKDKEAALSITKAVFISAFDTLSVTGYREGDYWPLLERYVLLAAAGCLPGPVTPAPRELLQDLSRKQAAPLPPAAPSKRRRTNSVRGALLLAFNILLSLLLAWLLIGLLIRLGALPRFDLGYTWFNQNVFLLF